MKTQSATLERNGASRLPASRNHAIRDTRTEPDPGFTLKPVVLMVGQAGSLIFITPIVAVAVPTLTQPELSGPTRQVRPDPDDDRDPKNPLHWMPAPLPNTTGEQF